MRLLVALSLFAIVAVAVAQRNRGQQRWERIRGRVVRQIQKTIEDLEECRSELPPTTVATDLTTDDIDMDRRQVPDARDEIKLLRQQLRLLRQELEACRVLVDGDEPEEEDEE